LLTIKKNLRRTIKDPSTGQDVVLSEKDLALVRRLQDVKIPNADHNEYKVRTTPNHVMSRTNFNFTAMGGMVFESSVDYCSAAHSLEQKILPPFPIRKGKDFQNGPRPAHGLQRANGRHRSQKGQGEGGGTQVLRTLGTQ
jgi:hypothetical protein